MILEEMIKNHSVEVTAPLCEKVEEFIKTLTISDEEFVLILIQMTGARCPPQSELSALLFVAYCVNATELILKKTRESN